MPSDVVDETVNKMLLLSSTSIENRKRRDESRHDMRPSVRPLDERFRR